MSKECLVEKEENLSLLWTQILPLYMLLVLGSKKLGTNVLEFQFVLCWQTMIKT